MFGRWRVRSCTSRGTRMYGARRPRRHAVWASAMSFVGPDAAVDRCTRSPARRWPPTNCLTLLTTSAARRSPMSVVDAGEEARLFAADKRRPGGAHHRYFKAVQCLMPSRRAPLGSCWRATRGSLSPGHKSSRSKSRSCSDLIFGRLSSTRTGPRSSCSTATRGCSGRARRAREALANDSRLFDCARCHELVFVCRPVIEINATAALSAETGLDGKTLLPVAVGTEIPTGVGTLLLSDRLGAGLV